MRAGNSASRAKPLVGKLFAPFFAMLFAASLLGCFTETGNPGEDNENAVLAKFYVDYDATATAKAAASDVPAIRVTSFLMTIGDAEFDTDLGDTDFFAGKPTTTVDFTVPKTILWIKPDALAKAAWRIFHFNFNIPAAPAGFSPDTIDYENFNHPAFLKGEVTYGSTSTNFLMQLPKLNSFCLFYLDSTLVKTKTEAGWNILMGLKPQRLLKGTRLDTLPVSHDKHGVPFALITQKASGGNWALLRNNFYHSFGVDSIEVEGFSIK